jgi:hypothetical protein
MTLMKSQRRIAQPKAQATPDLKGDYSRELPLAKWSSMNQLALQKIWLFSNSGRALALPATDAAVLGAADN